MARDGVKFFLMSQYAKTIQGLFEFSCFFVVRYRIPLFFPVQFNELSEIRLLLIVPVFSFSIFKNKRRINDDISAV